PQRRVPGPEGGRLAVLPAASPPHRDAARLGLLGERGGQARLADPRVAAEQDDASLAGERSIERGTQLLDLALAPDERNGRRGWPRPRSRLPVGGRLRQRPDEPDSCGTLGSLGVPGERTGRGVWVVWIRGPPASGDLAGELDGLPQLRPPRAAVGGAAR